VYYCRAFSASGGDTSAASLLIACTASPASSSGAVNVYFNKSVFTPLATVVPAAGNQDLPSHVITRMNNARRSIDAALYSLSGQPGDNIAAALLAAHQRGVAVRVICEADNRNSNAFSSLSSGGVPLIDDRFDALNAGAGYMHNKFFVFDGRGGAPESVWVWTGSWNPTAPGTNDDYQNVIEFQDAALARAYTLEFDEMWGSATDAPLAAASRFGARKTDNTPHRFVIGGRHVENYFSPSDRTTSHIAAVIAGVQHAIAVGTMTLTRADLASRLSEAHAGGKKVRIVLDNNTDTGTQFGTLQAQGLDIHLKTGPGIFHHKYLVADADNTSVDPVTVSGSHNWTNAAENSNNENIVIVHDAAVANQYLQEFAARYYQFGGVDSLTTDVEAGAPPLPAAFSLSQNFPNPFNPSTMIVYQLPSSSAVTLRVYDILGREVAMLVDGRQSAGTHAVRFDAHALASGVYFCCLTAGPLRAQRKMMLLR
jgi:phosphatidylserine/phosphatidylglycerophosphate/cardiolipin synthase-like enzyme